MKTYQAGKDPVEAWNGETRGWVFDLLENPRFRQRLETLATLDLRRRSGCEPCLRALVIDEWSYEALYHLSWCDSCRRASFALGMDTARKPVASSPRRRRALWLGLAAAAVIAVPVLGSQTVFKDDGQVARGGDAQLVGATTSGGTTTPGGVTTSDGTTTPGATTTSGGTTTPGGTTTVPTKVKPIPRSKPAAGSAGQGSSAGSGHAALPETT